MEETRNLIITILLSMVIVLGWRYFVAPPEPPKSITLEKPTEQGYIKDHVDNPAIGKYLDGEHIISQTSNHRIPIRTKNYTGSINLKGGRLDDLKLNNYRKTIDPGSDGTNILNPFGSEESFFATFNWLSNNTQITLPSVDTVWAANHEVLTPEQPLMLTYENPQGIVFKLKYIVDNNYMFTIEQKVFNHGHDSIKLFPYGLLNRHHEPSSNQLMILHEGFIGSFENKLKEVSYSDLADARKKSYKKQTGGWMGFVDKYWFTSLIPQQNIAYDAYSTYHQATGDPHQFRTEFIGQPLVIEPGEIVTSQHHLYSGPKVENILEDYQRELGLPLFEEAVDYGVLYFLTKPIFKALKFIHSMVGNFGVAIILLTILLKALTYPLARKSYRSMAKMRDLEPHIKQIKEMHEDDPTKLSQELMHLYKKEKINPVSGCFPMLLQLPIFFALYKVLFITIEMRHAPFFGWVTDLSAPDPTTIFNLFGVISWTPPEFLMIGAWPIIMAGTMLLQQQFNPTPSDPIQAKMMKLLPLVFLFLFKSFPAGLVIYWAVNNILTVIQQKLINS
ncbi:MAG: membrane protein insertase YidC [Pseudomonadota bacterium]